MPDFQLITCTSVKEPGWLPLRNALWPHSPAQIQLPEMAAHIEHLLDNWASHRFHESLGFEETK